MLGLALTAVACTTTSTTDAGQPVAQASSGATTTTTASTTDSSTKGGTTTGTTATDAEGKPTETKRNKDAKSYKESIAFAMDDIQSYWTETMPEVYGKDYVTIPASKLFPATEKKPAPACTPEGGTGSYDQVHDNAFYCRLGKFVAWDDQDLLPSLYKEFGEYSVAMVFAHEWGHAIQDQMGLLGTGLPTILTENQADCFAGAWTKHSLANTTKGGFRATAGDLQSALAGMLRFSDTKGADVNAQGAHGSGFDRVNGFQEGFEQGPEHCAGFIDNPPKVVNLPFTTQEELDSGGNLDYPTIIDLATKDLNAYWVGLGKQAGFDFQPVESIQPFSVDTAMPKCGKKTYSEAEALGTIFFCIDDNKVVWDEGMMQDVASQIGDMGVGVLLAKQWAISAQVQDGQPKDKIESKQGNLQQSCFAGAWARSLLGDKTNDPSGRTLSLSPGDLDEAIQAFLAFSEKPDDKGDTATGSAFEQAEAFRDGFLSDNGPQECASYSASSTSTSSGSSSGDSTSTDTGSDQ